MKKICFDGELKTALCNAMECEYSELNRPEQAIYEYTFSDKFDTQMRKVFRMADYRYVSVGRHRMRLLIAVALLTVAILAMTTGAVALQRIYVQWNEVQNTESGTVDIDFDVNKPNENVDVFEFIKPETPQGYRIEKEEKYSDQEQEIQYLGEDGTVIYYAQSGGVDTTNIGIDNENTEYRYVLVNSYKGYLYSKNGNCALIWTNGISLYQLTGNCKVDILEEMAESLV